MSTTSTTKVIGNKSYVQLLAESFKKEDSRYEKLMALGGFSLTDLAKQSGLTLDSVAKRVKRMGLYSESVRKPGGQGRRLIYLPEGVKPPRA